MLLWSTYLLGLNVSPRSTALLGVQRAISFLAYPCPNSQSVPWHYEGQRQDRGRRRQLCASVYEAGTATSSGRPGLNCCLWGIKSTCPHSLKKALCPLLQQTAFCELWRKKRISISLCILCNGKWVLPLKMLNLGFPKL